METAQAWAMAWFTGAEGSEELEGEVTGGSGRTEGVMGKAGGGSCRAEMDAATSDSIKERLGPGIVETRGNLNDDKWNVY